MRKMASIQHIAEVASIEGADAICAYRVNGWWVVDRVGAYQQGDLAIFCEVDAWIPHELAPFLSKGKEPREYNGVKGERLRTVKLRKQISQGLLLKIEDYFDIVEIEGRKFINTSKDNKTARSQDVYLQDNQQSQ